MFEIAVDGLANDVLGRPAPRASDFLEARGLFVVELDGEVDHGVNFCAPRRKVKHRQRPAACRRAPWARSQARWGLWSPNRRLTTAQ